MKDRLCIFVAVLMFVFRKSRVCFIWRFKDARRLVTRGFYSFCYYYLRLLSAPTASTIATTPTLPSTSTTSISFTSFITVSEAIYKSTSSYKMISGQGILEVGPSWEEYVEAPAAGALGNGLVRLCMKLGQISHT